MFTGVEQDYIDLFSFKRQGHLAKYVHMYRPYIYEEAITQDTYYPFKMECELIHERADDISKSLQNVTQALEIGPGSYVPVMNKTVPLLKALKKSFPISVYKALDSSMEYAQQACQLIRKEFKHLETEAIEIDFLVTQQSIYLGNTDVNGSKLIFAFGQSVFTNNDDHSISKFIGNLGNMLGKNDYFLFGADTNKDPTLLEAAYNSSVVHELLLNAFYFLKDKLEIESFDVDKFDAVYKWDPNKSIVEHYLRAKAYQNLKIGGREFVIKKDQEYNILNSRKMSLEEIEEFLQKERLFIKEIIKPKDIQANKFVLVIAQKK